MGCSWLYAINGTWVEYLKLLFDWSYIETDLLADIVVWRTSTHTFQGKRVFIKDMAYYLFAPDSQPTTIAESLGGNKEPGNPTNIPLDVLRRFHFTFLIRHPRRAIPSYFRCTVPPLDEVTGFYNFTPSEAGYVELVRLFDFLIDAGIVDRNNITVIDADDMLDNPESIIKQYCEKVGLDFKPEMLEWNDADREHAAELFEKWDGFHNDAIKSSHLRARSHAQVRLTIPKRGRTLTMAQKSCTEESENKDWVQKFGLEGQKVIRETVNANIPYYDYLRSFCMKV